MKKEKRAIDITIGKNLLALRKQFNLTQAEIGAVVGLKQGAYKHYEIGTRMAPISVLQELAKFYKVSVHYFFENMPTLSEEEQREFDKFAYRIINSDPKAKKYITIQPPKEFKKYLDEQQKKIQAVARLRIKKLRTENNKTQQDLAKRLGVDISTYNKYESGKRSLNNEVVKQIADFYNIQVTDILD